MISNFHVAHLTANGAMGNANGEKNAGASRRRQSAITNNPSAGTKLSTAICVSLSTNTSLMKRSAEKQATGSASPQRPCGKLASAASHMRRLARRRQPPGKRRRALFSAHQRRTRQCLPPPGRQCRSVRLRRAGCQSTSALSRLAMGRGDCRAAAAQRRTGGRGSSTAPTARAARSR